MSRFRSLAGLLLVGAGIVACSGTSGTALPATTFISPSVGQTVASGAAISGPPASSVTEPKTLPSEPISSAPESAAESVTAPPVESPPASAPESAPESSAPESIPSSEVVQSPEVSTTQSLPVLTVETTSAGAKKIIVAVNGVLLTPAEVGTGFTKATYTPPDPKDTTSRLPCGQRSAAVLFPNALRTGTEIVKGNTAQFDESVSVFLDEKTAAGAYAVSVAGFNCKSGTTGTTPVTITATEDVTAQVGGDKAQAWDLKLGQDSAVLIGVRTGVITVGYTFIVAGGTDTSTLPNPLDLAKVATARLVKLQQ